MVFVQNGGPIVLLDIDAARDNATGELLLSYGVNDCEARVARLALDEVRRMLQPWPPR